MKSEEIQKLKKLSYSQIDLNKKYNIKFKDKILGFGCRIILMICVSSEGGEFVFIF